MNAPSTAAVGTTIALESDVACPTPLYDLASAEIVTNTGPVNQWPAPTKVNGVVLFPKPDYGKVVAQSNGPVDTTTGAWQLQLPVPRTVAPGRYALHTSCINRGGTDLTYALRPLTVTAP